MASRKNIRFLGLAKIDPFFMKDFLKIFDIFAN